MSTHQANATPSVAPGPFWTPLQPASAKTPEQMTKMGEGTEFGRPGQPVELAATYVLLVSTASSFMTGEVMVGSGGKTPF